MHGSQQDSAPGRRPPLPPRKLAPDAEADGLIEGRKVYISRINASDNTIELAWWEELFQNDVKARDFNWLCDPPQGEIEASVRVRHTKWENPPCTAVIQEDGSVLIRCSDPVRAPAAGQSAVLYSGDRVLGGGFIFFS